MTETFPGVQEKSRQDHLAYDASLFVASRMHADPHACFDNALTMLGDYPRIFAGGTFVEGWYVVEAEDEVVVNEHGWCELHNGVIVDPTVVLLVPTAQPVFYFPGVRRTPQEVAELLERDGVWFPYVRAQGSYGEDGLDHPVYKAAYRAAKEKAYTLAQARKPAKQVTLLRAQDLDVPDIQVIVVTLASREEG